MVEVSRCLKIFIVEQFELQVSGDTIACIPGVVIVIVVIKDVLKHIFLEPHLKKNGTKSLVKSIGLPILLIAECTKIILNGKQIF